MVSLWQLDRAGSHRALALDVLLLGRPWFWPVSLLPYYVGLVLATHRLVPVVPDLPRALAGAVVAGPLVWCAVLAINDVYDLPGDRLNPRKARSPLITGGLTGRTAVALAVVASGVALLIAFSVGIAFALGTSLALALGWAYSAPPIRLKERPGADVAVNALGIGALGPWAGWAALHSIGGFPWAMAVQGTLVGIALYVPSTLADYPADRASGYLTIAVRLGRRRAYRLGLAAWFAAGAWSALLAATDTVIPRGMLPMELLMVPTLVVAYHRILRPAQSFRRIAAVSFLFLIPSFVFALRYVHLT
jgi:chlorophyll synthase